MAIPLLQVDAFTDRPFAGNPAAVCLLREARDAAWMQRVAAEMNVSETAFPVALGDAAFSLRWFTPTVEVPLCGHATLGAAHAIWESGLVRDDRTLEFRTASGVLRAWRGAEGWIDLDLPAAPFADVEAGSADAETAARIVGALDGGTRHPGASPAASRRAHVASATGSSSPVRRPTFGPSRPTSRRSRGWATS